MPKVKPSPADKKNGVTIRPWQGHEVYRWRVTFPEGGKRKTKGFKTRAGSGGAEEFAALKRGEIKKNGQAQEPITPSEHRAVLMFREKASELLEFGDAISLEELVLQWAKNQRTEEKRVPISTMIDLYLTHLETKRKKKGGGLLSKVYKDTVRQRLEPFRQDYGDWATNAITQEVVSDWLQNLRKVKKTRKGRGTRNHFAKRPKEGLHVSEQTRNHFWAALHGLFEFALLQGAARMNPVTSNLKSAVGFTDIGILSPKDALTLLTQCEGKTKAVVAIGLFAGLRRAEIFRLDWSYIDLEPRTSPDGRIESWGEIIVTRNNARKGHARAIPVSENLHAWLVNLKPTDGGPVAPSLSTYQRRLQEAVNAIQITWPKNALRHSFATYHYAKHRTKQELREIMGHEPNSKILEDHYQGEANKNQAEDFWNIFPQDTK